MHKRWAGLALLALWRQEFGAYNAQTLRRDLLAGLTVGAVALPLALAFGVAGGADAAAGLLTAIVAGVVIAGLGGAPFQISGPTGAMSAVLITLVQGYGLRGVWIATLLAGVMLIALGVLRLGRYIAFIPSPVITGFTSGIAIIIAVGQLDNVLGVQTAPAPNTLAKLLGYVVHPPLPNWQAVIVAAVVVTTMLVLPRLTRTVPGSLVGLALATVLVTLAGWNVPVIGAIPRTLWLDQRLTWTAIPWGDVPDLLGPAVSIAALGAIESLLCGAVGSTMTGVAMNNNQELIAQGVGNLLLPFVGGVPATAAIARSSVGIKSGGVTRMTSFVHAGVLVLSVFVLAPVLGRVPLAALGGVLLVTAWRMNEWEVIHFWLHARLKHALAGLIITMIATAALDLTEAILIGIVISALIYIRQAATSLAVSDVTVDPAKLPAASRIGAPFCAGVRVYYLTGAIFFGSVYTMLEAFRGSEHYHTLVLSMRGVPMLDVMGSQALEKIVQQQRQRGGTVLLSGVQPAVETMLRRTKVLDLVNEDALFWSADQAIGAALTRHAAMPCALCVSAANATHESRSPQPEVISTAV